MRLRFLSAILALFTTFAAHTEAKPRDSQVCETIRLGQDSLLPIQDSYGKDIFSADSRYLLSAGRGQGTCSVFDVKERKTIYGPKPCEDGKLTGFNSTGTHVLLGDASGDGFTLIDLRKPNQPVHFSGREFTLFEKTTFSPDGKQLALKHGQSLVLMDLESGAKKSIPFGELMTSAAFTDNTDEIAVAVRKDQNETTWSELYFYNLKTGKKELLPIRHRGINNLTFSPDGQKIAFLTFIPRTTVEDVRVYDRKTQKTSAYKSRSELSPFIIEDVFFSPTGKSLALVYQVGMNSPEIVTYDTSAQSLGAMKSERLMESSHQLRGTKSAGKAVTGEEMLYDWYSRRVTFAGLESKKIKAEARRLYSGLQSPDGNFGLKELYQPRSAYILESLKTVCVNPVVITPPGEKTCADCNPKQTGALEEEQALARLESWEKSDSAFLPEKDLPVLLGILDSHLAEKHAAKIWKALALVYTEHPNLFKDLSERLKRLPPLQSESEISLSADQKAALFKTLQTDVQKITGTEIESFRNIDAFTNHYSLFLACTPQQRALIAESVEDKLSKKAADSWELNGIFPSTLSYLVGNAIAPTFALPKYDAAQVTWLRASETTIQPVILATGKIDNSYPDSSLKEFGFASKKLVPVGQPPEFDREVSFSFQGKNGPQEVSAKMHGKFKISDKKVKQAKKAPDYAAHLSDGKWRGMIVIGQNMGESSTSQMLKEYVDYYQSERRYTFSMTAESVDDFGEYFHQQLGDSSLDYLLKEAHSDGDPNNLFRMSLRGLIWRGKKPAQGNSPAEEVEIVVPSAASAEQRSILVSNQSFGRAVKDRKSPLVYFNTSCWSYRKAANELTAADSSPMLTIIPTMGITYGFSNHPSSAEYQLLNAFLGERSYEEIRQNLQFTPGYQSKKSDHFIFPDEAIYDNTVRSVARTPLDVSIEMTDAEGRPYLWDDRIHGRTQ